MPFVPTTKIYTPLTANTPANGNVPQVAPVTQTENAENANDPFVSVRHITGGARNIMVIVAVVLGFVVLAPLIISGQDLYHWAQSRTGLDLQNTLFALLIPVVFDLAATSCIGMTIIGSVWRKERSGLFGLLVWVFAASSAFAQYRNGAALAKMGIALDARWAFPLIALLGPLLLEATLNKLRKWARQDDGNQANGRRWFRIPLDPRCRVPGNPRSVGGQPTRGNLTVGGRCGVRPRTARSPDHEHPEAAPVLANGNTDRERGCRVVRG